MQTAIALNISTPQRVFTAAKCRAGIDKVGGIHSLRHAYATHQLEAGLPVHQLQRLLGHQNIHSTLHYVHWVPGYRAGDVGTDLIAARFRLNDPAAFRSVELLLAIVDSTGVVKLLSAHALICAPVSGPRRT